MREIKFRCFVKTKKIMREVIGRHYNGNNFWVRYGEEFNIIENRENIILMQYVGIKDKLGKEIYEGDIIQYFIDNIGVVKFIDGAFMVESEFGFNFAINSLLNIADEVKVIGNIFENKDLLERDN